MPRKREVVDEENISLKERMTKNKKETDIQKLKEKEETELIKKKIVSETSEQPKKPSGLKKAKLLAETVTGKKPEEKISSKDNNIEPVHQEILYNQGMYNGQRVNYGQVPGMGSQQPINIIVQVPENKMTGNEEKKRQTLSDAETREHYEKWDEEEKAAQSVGKTIARKIGGTILNLAILVVIFFVVKLFLATIVPISGDSMSPTYNNNDKLLMERVSYYIKDPQIDDIIYLKLDNGTNLIKRVVGVPGDSIQIIGGILYRNDEAVETTFDLMTDSGMASNKIKLEYDEYFVLGDNRNDSNDSRNPTVGIIDRDQIKGRIIFKIWPLSNTRKSQSEDEAVGL